MSPVDDARIALLSWLIDHAALFPPASLPLPDAVKEDRRARASRSSFVLARFVCPASRLGELPDVGRGVSVVLDGPLEADRRVEAVEAPAGYDLGAGVPSAASVYVEVALDDALEERLDALAANGLGAKVPCGGASVPDRSALARFLRACAERGLPFKATAGLHHALRRDGEHGFLNLLAAVVFGDEEAALHEADPSAIALDSESFTWRGRCANPDELAKARRDRLHSIGSCSFFEPVEELESLGVLPL
ncbi:MAG: hypothetical protein ACRDNY_03740 [Gaiellaceae bacterium]